MAENRIIKLTSGASSKGQALFYELSGNGTNYNIITAPDSLAANATITLPSSTATLATLGLAETFSGAKTFSDTVTISGTSLTSSSATLAGTWAGNPTFSGTVSIGDASILTMSGHNWSIGGDVSFSSSFATTTAISLDQDLGTGTTPTFAGLTLTNDIAVNTNKFTIDASTGNTLIAGTLEVTGIATFTAAPVFSSVTGSQILEVTAGKALTSVATTGTGSVVKATSPTLVTPILGTPTSGTLTNCTIPIGGVSGLGSNVATFLATPSSANLKSAVTDETGSGALVFGTSPSISAATFTGNTSGTGIVPLGAIIPIYDSGLSGTFSIPSSGTVSQGWQLCDGSAVAGSQTVSGTTPNLTGDIFLMGDTASGNTGGSNSSAHTHTFAHTHGTDSQLSNYNAAHTHTVASHTHEIGSHTHGIAHAHQWGIFDETNADHYSISETLDDSIGELTSYSGLTKFDQIVGVASGTGAYCKRVSSDFLNGGEITELYTTGVLSPPSGSNGSTAASGSSSVTNTGGATPATNSQLETITLAHTHTTNSQSTSTTSAASATENRPNYISVRYIMRVS